MDIREIHSVELLDVSPVVYPAYKGTTVGVRAIGDLEEIRTAHAAWKREQAEAEALRQSIALIKQRAAEVAAKL